MGKKIIYIVLLLAVQVLSINKNYAQDENNTELTISIKSELITLFTQSVEWPHENDIDVLYGE